LARFPCRCTDPGNIRQIFPWQRQETSHNQQATRQTGKHNPFRDGGQSFQLSTEWKALDQILEANAGNIASIAKDFKNQLIAGDRASLIKKIRVRSNQLLTLISDV
jgi:uncharacterized Zn ribbon protein